MSLAVRHIEVYVFEHRAGRARVLALRRSPVRRLPGIWQPVTGKLERRETIFAAAAREVREETGILPVRWWLLEAPVLYFDRATGSLCAAPRFAAEVEADAAVRLSAEHDAYALLAPDGAARRFLWDSQREAVRLLERQVLRGGPLAAALEIPVARFRRRGRR